MGQANIGSVTFRIGSVSDQLTIWVGSISDRSIFDLVIESNANAYEDQVDTNNVLALVSQSLTLWNLQYAKKHIEKCKHYIAYKDSLRADGEELEDHVYNQKVYREFISKAWIWFFLA
ncbi:hypothetical protein GQ457_05G025180 [Hibiscus cannabinus]